MRLPILLGALLALGVLLGASSVAEADWIVRLGGWCGRGAYHGHHTRAVYPGYGYHGYARRTVRPAYRGYSYGPVYRGRRSSVYVPTRAYHTGYRYYPVRSYARHVRYAPATTVRYRTHRAYPRTISRRIVYR